MVDEIDHARTSNYNIDTRILKQQSLLFGLAAANCILQTVRTLKFVVPYIQPSSPTYLHSQHVPAIALRSNVAASRDQRLVIIGENR